MTVNRTEHSLLTMMHTEIVKMSIKGLYNRTEFSNLALMLYAST